LDSSRKRKLSSYWTHQEKESFHPIGLIKIKKAFILLDSSRKRKLSSYWTYKKKKAFILLDSSASSGAGSGSAS
jgi:hypothetical protein